MLTDRFIRDYILVHEEKCLYSILQTLKYFKIDHQITGWLDDYIKDLLETKRHLAENRGCNKSTRKAIKDKAKKSGSREPIGVEERQRKVSKKLPTRRQKKLIQQGEDGHAIIEPYEIRTICGVCECGAPMVGEPVRSCERKKNGRVFYRECTKCSRYIEIFEKDEVFTEIEGG